jgi:hypothetical protein
VLMVVYCAQYIQQKRSLNPWLTILFGTVLILTVLAPRIIDWADGPEPLDPYGHVIKRY